ncbi:MAG: SpoIIE family protein phosphatase [Solirubrobacterales bacterium]|nr:SpoIIE family protein phosphatase [Solirubrobacterales bacterium]
MLVGGAVVAALVVGVVLAVLLRWSLALTDAQRVASRAEVALAQAARTEKLIVDLETGVRGYVITGEKGFLEPYESARSAAPRAARRLEQLTTDRSQRLRAATVGTEIREYVNGFAEPLLNSGSPVRTSERAKAVAVEGKRRLDSMRAELAAFSALERARFVERSAAADRRAERAQKLAVVALACLLGMLAALAVLVDRAFVRPVRRLARGVERLQRGDLSERLDQRGPVEIAALGTAIDELAESLSASRFELEERNAELRRLGERNLILLDGVFAQTPAGLAFFDRDLRYVRVNVALAAMSGRPVEAHLGRQVEEIVPALAQHARRAMEEVLVTGHTVADVEVRGETAAEPGVQRDWLITHYPVRQDGEVVGLGVVVVDITARKRAEEEREQAHDAERRARRAAEIARARAAFLADAGAVLDATLDLDETLDSLASLCVPRVADWCSIEMVEPGGRLRNAAVAHPDPSRVEEARELQRRYPPDPDAPTGSAAVIRTGRAELYPEVGEELEKAGAVDADHLELIRGLGMRSAMIVPLTARGETFGAITFVAAESGRRFDADDFGLAQDLGLRAAMALDNARLYRERSHVARTLQASLLPEVLPEIPGVRIAARYEPLGAGTEVGGDFYDVFPIGDRRWAVVIGDVCGKGAEAAALTALARYTLRAVAPVAPAEALLRLNAAILRQRNDMRFITIIYAELDLGGARPCITLACGGHPPPLLVHASGESEVVACQGTLIGVTPDPELSQVSVELAPGDTLAFYTDGVSEASHAEPLDGHALLARLNGARSADAVADELQRLARSTEAPARDDVAILALQVN